MKTSLPVSTSQVVALLALTAGLLTAALWSTQPAQRDIAAGQQADAVIDHSIPSITITAKRMSKAEKKPTAYEEIDPAVPHLVVIGHRIHTVASLGRML